MDGLHHSNNVWGQAVRLLLWTARRDSKKPAPDGALRIAEELGVPAKECLYIGDTNTDMKTGAAAGMDTAGALWGFRDRRELEENPRGLPFWKSPQNFWALSWVTNEDAMERIKNC